MTTPDLRYSDDPCYPLLQTSTPWADRWDRIYWRSSPLPTVEEMRAATKDALDSTIIGPRA